MRIFRKPELVAWRPAPWWLSLLESVMLCAMPVLLVAPAVLGFGPSTMVLGWLGFAMVLFLYGWLFNRLRPANPPTEALRPKVVGVYGTTVVVALVAVAVACMTETLWAIGLAFAVAVVLMTVVSQWFERALEKEVTARGLDRSPRAQSHSVVKDLRRGPVDPDAPTIMSERASERWAREQRERQEERLSVPAPTRTVAQGQDLPELETVGEVRQVYRPTDRRASDNPNKRRKKRRR